MKLRYPTWVRTFLVGAMLTGWLPLATQASLRDDTLVVALPKALTTVDRLYSIQREGLIVAELTDDGLFGVNTDTLEFEPLAAESFHWTGDTRLDVTLRDNVRFHDGSALTADDVVYTYEWVLNEASETSRGPVIRSWLDRVEKTGPLSVRFHLNMPYPMALRDMAVSIPLRKRGTYDDAQGEVPHNGIGPYRVKRFNVGRDIVLERFADYYPESPKSIATIKNIVFRVIPDEGTQQAELLSGGIDLMMDVPPDVADNVSALPGVARLQGNDIRIGYLTLDAAGHSDPDSPMTDVKVRRAINHAINREAITRYLVRGSAEAIPYACHPRQFGCEADGPRYPYDPEKARQLLAEAGYPNGFSFKVWAYRDKVIAESIASDLKAVGLNADLRYVKLNVFSKMRNDQPMEAFFASYGGGGTADASASTGVHFIANTSRNFTGDASLAETVLAAERTIDPDERRRLYRTALNRIAEQAYWVPLFSYSQNYLLSPALSLPVPEDGVPRLWQAAWRPQP